MKNKAFVLLKQIIKSKSQVAKRRLVELSLTMKSKKLSLLGNMSNKIHSTLGQHEEDQEEERQENIGNQSNAISMCNEANSSSNLLMVGKAEDIIEHSILDEDDELDDNQEGSVIDLVKKSKEEGQDFSLEDEIDNVADLFIRRFHKQIRMQKLESFKRYQEMLARSV